MTAPPPLLLAASRRRPQRQPWAPNRNRPPLADGGPAMPGHFHALLDVEAARVFRTEREGRHRWHWCAWGDVARIQSPRRRYFVDLVLAGHVEQAGQEPAVLTESGVALLAELRERWRG